MPKPTASKRNDYIDECEAEWERFSDPDAWIESKTKPGNYWRDWEGATVTIFRCKVGSGHGWCIAEPDSEPRFSKGKIADFDAALSKLADALEVGLCV